MNFKRTLESSKKDVGEYLADIVREHMRASVSPDKGMDVPVGGTNGPEPESS